MFGWLLGLKIEGIGLLAGVGTHMGSIGKLHHYIITMSHGWCRRMLIVSINDDNSFLHKIVEITFFFLLDFCVLLLQVVQYTNSPHALLLQQERKEIEKAKAI